MQHNTAMDTVSPPGTQRQDETERLHRRQSDIARRAELTNG